MFSMSELFEGVFDVEFVGDPRWRRITFTQVIESSNGNIVCLFADDGTIYNYYTIIRMERVE